MKKLLRRIVAVFNLARGRGLSPEIFDLLYSVKKDPWNYRSSDYEQSKYQDTLSMLPDGLIGDALEVGCAEGVFTQMLAPRVTNLTGLDVSSTALERAGKALTGTPNVTFSCLNIADENPKGKYNLIVVSEVLYYMGSNANIGAVAARIVEWLHPNGHLILCHLRSQVDEAEGHPVPRFGPSHPGAATVHGIFDGLPSLQRRSQLDRPFYRVSLYQRV